MTPHDITMLFLALGILLAAGRGLGDLAKRLNQPEVVGEILAGILLGPTVLGVLAPGLTASLFPAEGSIAIALTSLTALGITLFLLAAGLEVDFPAMRRHGRVATGVGFWGMVIPFAVGFSAAWLWPGLLEREPKIATLAFALFFATALSISALPVIARVLMDLDIYRTKVGMVTIGAAFGQNLFGAIMFAIILGMVGAGLPSGWGIGGLILMSLGFAAAMLTGVRWCVHRVLPWVEGHMSRSSGVLGFALSLAFLGAAFSEWLGTHAILGAFLVGVVVGDSAHFHDRTRATVLEFVSAFFAPLFFATIGLRVNFVASFDWELVVVVLVLATAGKVVGCGLGARMSGWNAREAGAIGFAMNARGAMEIVFGLLGFQYGIISERMFVALVVMAIATSMMSGPTIRRLLKLGKPRPFLDYRGVRVCLRTLETTTRQDALKELVQAMVTGFGNNARGVEASLVPSDFMRSSGFGGGVRVCATEVEGLAQPLIGLGIARTAIEFDDMREPAELIFVVLTPGRPDSSHWEIVSELAETFHDAETRQRALRSSTPSELLSRLGP